MNDSERLRIEVQDERARRRWAEQELVAEVEKSNLWRKRAEERTARIRLLEERLSANASRQAWPRRFASAAKRLLNPRIRRAVSGSEVAEPPPSADGAVTAETVRSSSAVTPTTAGVLRGRRPSQLTTRAAILGGSDLPFLNEFETVDLEKDENALYDSDFVFIVSSAMATAPARLRSAIVAWLDLAGRQPLVVWVDDTRDSREDNLTIAAAADHRIGPGATAFSPGFDSSTAGNIPDSVRIMADNAESALALATHEATPLEEMAGLMATGIPVLTPGMCDSLARRLGIARVDEVSFASAVLNHGDLRLRLAVAGRRLAWREFSPVRRAEALLTLLDVTVPRRSQQVGVLLLSNKPHLIVGAVETVVAQKGVDVFPVIGLHGSPGDFASVREKLQERLAGCAHVVFDVDSSVPLGEALNRAAALCSSPILAKMDDDDWYGAHYLEDAVYSMQAQTADLVGKARYFVEVEEAGDVYLVEGPEEQFTNHVIGSSLVFRRRLWEDVPFSQRPSRVDSLFLRAARAADASIYSNSRFEFAVRRRADGHTWIVHPAHFAARGHRVGSTIGDADVSAPDSLLRGFMPPSRS